MNATATVTVSAEALAGLIRSIFIAAGLAEAAAQTVANGLIDADLEGLASHGVMLVDLYVDRIQAGSVSTADSGTVVSDNSVAVVLDAGHALGHLTGDQAIGLAIDRAHRLGAGIVAVRHGFHFGTARRYAVRAAEAGCIGIVGCNTRPLMPAPGGAERVVGNNPLAIAVPTDGPIPLVLDMATSEAAMGKIRMAAKQNKPIPAGWAVDAQGSPTTDPETAIAGMLLPTGGPKGFGLSLLIDLICGLLSGGATGRDVQPLYGDFAKPYDCSHIFIAIDVAHFGDVAAFKSAAATAAEQIRSGKRAPGVNQLFTPGEPEWRNRARAQGQLTLPSAVVDMLTRYATKLGVSPHPFTP